MKALKSVNEYQKYGFRCARDMIITAINIYSQNSDPDVRKLLNGIVDIEELANRIVCKLEERQIVIKESGLKAEMKATNSIEKSGEEDIYKKALSFIDTL
ncbi:hypothetical protein [Anaerobutyricum hallii]|uniref:hypothetical protein n=1 Tax=Anaerobutyricum hallii TaxID=39488 RepID=UPI001C01277F|nr:hypothetical protein [Anaerobutyricum hallii]MBT9714629.1 hypothetical protein [Anaerobutyricum hallii]